LNVVSPLVKFIGRLATWTDNSKSFPARLRWKINKRKKSGLRTRLLSCPVAMDSAKRGQLAPRQPKPWPKSWLLLHTIALIDGLHSLLRTGAGQLDKLFNCHLGSSSAFSPAVLLATIAQIERCHPWDRRTQSNHSPKPDTYTPLHLEFGGSPLTQLIKQQFGSWKRRRWRQSKTSNGQYEYPEPLLHLRSKFRGPEVYLHRNVQQNTRTPRCLASCTRRLFTYCL